MSFGPSPYGAQTNARLNHAFFMMFWPLAMQTATPHEKHTHFVQGKIASETTSLSQSKDKLCQVAYWTLLSHSPVAA
jgi:hypothetical protein